jgi:superfamily II DNA/RNA helicase
MNDTTAPEAPTQSALDSANITFADFELAEPISRAIADQGYIHPTPIQQQAIPVAISGRDLMGAAQTGTGKTAGFSLPILQRLLPLASSSASPARHPVRALILTPTRELADQVAENVHAYGKYTSLRSCVVFGGVDMNPQRDALRSGVEIVIATPGRLLDHVQQKNVNLGQVQIFVMDEADRMLDMGFLPDLQRIINLLPQQRQNMMFSATFSDEIKKLARTFLNNPATIEVERRNSANEAVTQTLYAVRDDDKRAALVQILKDRNIKQVIVFVNTKLGASRLARALERDGIVATAIHGDRSQAERLKALDDFKGGKIEALVATDVAARGLDISDLPCVVNYDIPNHAEDYVHRIGRTGRAGALGDAISLMAPDEERAVADIEKLIKRSLPRAELQLHERAPRRMAEDRHRKLNSEDEERPARVASTRRHEASSERRPSRPSPQDEWFLKPYEPAAPTVDNATGADSAANVRRGKPAAIGALLGGPRKKG